MHRPRMILFDYGETLASHRPFDSMAVAVEIMKHVTDNPKGVTAEMYAAFTENLHHHFQASRDIHCEIHDYPIIQYTMEALHLKTSLSIQEVEQIRFDFGLPTRTEPGMQELLDWLHENGIRTGVISNISFSGRALKRRIDALYPDHNFEFIFASSEYVFRKPHPAIFKMALIRAELDAGEVWYAGDSYRFDVTGAASAGIFPVQYLGGTTGGVSGPEEIEHLTIHHWDELMAYLKSL